MSRRTILSLVASVIMGSGLWTVSTDASAYYRRVCVYRGGVTGRTPGVAVGIVLLRSCCCGRSRRRGAYRASYIMRHGHSLRYYPYPPCY